jgi:hypothetical protein
MADEPAYRVSSCRAMFAQLDRHFPEQARALRATIPGEAMAVVNESLNLTWIPASLHHQIVDPVYRALGDRDYRVLWLKTFLDMVRLPLFWPVTETALRLFGSTPSSLAKWTARGYTLATRGLGRFQLTIDEPENRRVVLDLSGYPPALAASGANVVGTAGSLDGYLVLTRVDASRGFARFEIRWNP